MGARKAATGSSPSVSVAIWSSAVLAVIILGVSLVSALSGDDDSTIVPGPTAEAGAGTVELLARAHAAHRICYGWQLTSWGSSVVSAGSNRGVDAPLSDDGTFGCPRWIRVDGDVRYTSVDSETEDSAVLSVSSSPELSTAGFLTRLADFGIDSAVLVDDPAWAITRAAVLLPLLTVESGQAEAVPAATEAAAGVTPPPLPDAGSDMWRARWGYLVTGGVLLLVAVVLALFGLADLRYRRAIARIGR
jgi:hypothetical protein